MELASSKGARVFLTGVTGFVGKVVLEELLRRYGEEDLQKVYVLIRSDRHGHSPQERFQKEVVASPCFSKLPSDWTRRVKVISGELAEPGCGIGHEDREKLVDNVTHIINCAASIEFDLPVKEAAAANITASLNVLEFARWCTGLKNMVNVSTAYVTPHRNDAQPIAERLVPLKRPAQMIYHSIVDGTAHEKALLRETGHPNTYTLTKCLSEHMLNERRGDVPLTIVRPSIVSATWRHPFPGWIDSKAAFAGFVALIGTGYLRAVIAQYSTLLDVVPCDEVALRIIEAAFAVPKKDAKEPVIRHTVAGVSHSCNIETCIDVIEDFFHRHPVDRHADLNYVGSKNLRFHYKAFKYHHGPAAAMYLWYGLRGQFKKRQKAQRLVKQLNYLNEGFPYFTHNTFDFRSSMPLEDPAFNKQGYIETVCRGVYRHLLKKDDTEVLLAGREQRSGGDLRWVWKQPWGNWAIRLGAYLVRKSLRRCTDRITFDRPSFEAARAMTPDDSLILIVPTHRSYMDFVLCSYLCFAQTNLGIAIPHIMAAEEFSRIPILGWLFKQAQAFYVKRGLGRPDPSMTHQVHRLVDDRETLEFFIEGTRSRSRQLLSPRRGMLKCLQATGQTCTIFPVTISYDRVPEEAAFMRELRGNHKPKMRWGPLLRWALSLVQGKVHLGRIHMSCGTPLTLEPETDLHALGREVITEFQKGMAVTTHHLRCFLKQNPGLEIDLDWLKHTIVRRGGKVIESKLGGEHSVDPAVERSMRYQWMHLFYDDVRASHPDHPAIQNHIVKNAYARSPEFDFAGELKNRRLQGLLRALFKPICDDYAAVSAALGSTGVPLQIRSPRDMVRQNESSHLPTVEEAWQDLVARRILAFDEAAQEYVWGPCARDLEEYKKRCPWPEVEARIAEVG